MINNKCSQSVKPFFQNKWRNILEFIFLFSK